MATPRIPRSLSHSTARIRPLFDQDESRTPGRRPADSASEQTSAGERDLLEQVRQRLGLPEPLVPRAQRIVVEHLIIEHPEDRVLQAGARRLARNMLLNGLLHAPAVVPAQTGDAHAPGRFVVWFGQRRALAAQLLHAEGVPGWEAIPCEVYTLPDPLLARRIRATLTLSENLCRSEQRWVEDLRNLVTFLDHPAPLRDAEIWQALGIDPQRFKALVLLARLPRPILDQAFAGQISSEGLLRKIARRLNVAQRGALAERAAAGEVITAALVDALWHGALGDALTTPALQVALAQNWLADTPPQALVTTVATEPEVDRWPLDLTAVPDIPQPFATSPVDALGAPRPQPPIAPSPRQDQPAHLTPPAAEEDYALAELISLWESIQRALPLLQHTAALRQARLYAQALAQELDPWRRRAKPHATPQ